MVSSDSGNPGLTPLLAIIAVPDQPIERGSNSTADGAVGFLSLSSLRQMRSNSAKEKGFLMIVVPCLVSDLHLREVLSKNDQDV